MPILPLVLEAPVGGDSLVVVAGVIAAAIGGKIRVTFPQAIQATSSVFTIGNYSITIPSGAPVLFLQSVTQVNSTVIDITYSGSMIIGGYTLGIATNTVTYVGSTTPIAVQVLDFVGQAPRLASKAPVLHPGSSSLLGSGLAFPLQIGSDGEFLKVTGEDNVNCCVFNLIRTRKKERPHVVRNGVPFGTDLHLCLFEDQDIAKDLAFQTVNEALAIWEPRVSLVELRAENQKGSLNLILISLKYLVIASNNVNNLIFPFSLNQSQGS